MPSRKSRRRLMLQAGEIDALLQLLERVELLSEYVRDLLAVPRQPNKQPAKYLLHVAQD